MKVTMSKLLMISFLTVSASMASAGGGQIGSNSLNLQCGSNIKVTLNGPADGSFNELAVEAPYSTTILVKTEGPDRTLFGKAKGLGLFEAPGVMRLDLRNVVDSDSIILEDLQSGQSVQCFQR